MEISNISDSVSKNKEQIVSIIGNGFDIEFREFIIPAFDNSNALIIYINNTVDDKEIYQAILTPLMKFTQLPGGSTRDSNNKTAILMNYIVFAKQAKEAATFSEVCDAIMLGDTVLFVDKCNTALILSTNHFKARSITEPVTESEVRGPRDGFIEDINTNCSLIRRRIRDYGLRFENIKIGDRTKTDIVLVYIDNIVNDSILEEVKTRLNRIKIDSILASAYIEEFIEDSPRSIFPQIEHTERPDKACMAILEGRILIMVDNSPFSLIVPTVFWNFVQSSGDYYDRYYFGTFVRIIRFLTTFLSLTLTSAYVLLASYDQEMLPTVLALKIAEGRQGVPFPAVIEALLMEIILEILKEAGLRMPKPIGMTVSIVGTFVIGQAVMLAGLASPILIIFVSLSAICSYANPSYSFGNSVRLLRFFMLLLTSTLGLLGYLGGIVFIALNLLSMRSFGQQFLAPVIPFSKDANKDVLIRAPWWKMKKRSNIASPKDIDRQSPTDLKPKPPTQGV